MLVKPRTFFAIHRFESKPFADSAGNLEVMAPMLQSGLLGPTDCVDFGWTEALSAELVAEAVQEHCAVYGPAPVVVYGAGAHTTQYWSAISQLNVVAIADKNPALWGSRVKGLAVIRPADIPQYAGHVLISSRAFESNITRELAASLPAGAVATVICRTAGTAVTGMGRPGCGAGAGFSTGFVGTHANPRHGKSASQFFSAVETAIAAAENRHRLVGL